jgi:nucleoside-diphosphate-sugar epimerase
MSGQPFRRVLVTGGAGFLGSHLCERFLAEGCEVLCFDNLLTGRMDNVAHLLGHERFSFEHYDVTNHLYVSGPSMPCCTSPRRRARQTSSGCRSRS